MMLADSGLTDPMPFLRVASQLIMWFGVLFLASLILNFIKKVATLGFSHMLADWLWNEADTKGRSKICRWFGNGDEILAQLKKMDAASKEA